VRVTRTQVAWIACASAAAMLAVAFWILWGASGSEGSKAFISTPQFILWVLVLAAQAVVWVLGTFAAVSIIRRRARPLFASGALSARTVLQIAVGGLVLFVLAGLTIGSLASKVGLIPEEIGRAGIDRPISPLEHANVKMPALVLVGVVAGVIAIGGMWLVSLAFEGIGARNRVHAASLRRFIGLRDDLNTLLAIAGVIVGLAVLSSGALREAVLAANDQAFYRDQTVWCLRHIEGQPKSAAEVLTKLDDLKKAYPTCVQLKFDQEYVLEYGLFFSGLLAIAYTPCFLAVRRAGTRLRDRAYPLLAPGTDGFFERLDERRQLDAFLQTSLSANANFKAAAAILTPLAGSLLSLLIPT
jgi:hypothetical protein